MDILNDIKARVSWPAEGFTDDDGVRHAWTDLVPDEDGTVPDADDPEAWDYRDLAIQLAENDGEMIEDWLAARYGGEEKLSPPWINDGDGYGE